MLPIEFVRIEIGDHRRTRHHRKRGIGRPAKGMQAGNRIGVLFSDQRVAGQVRVSISNLNISHLANLVAHVDDVTGRS